MKILNEHKVLFFLIAFSILFKDYLIPLYQKIIVKGILEHASDSILMGIVYLISLAYLIVWTILKLKRGFYLKSENLIYASLIIIFYSIIRYKYGSSLLAFERLQSLKYFDIIYILATIPFILIFSKTNPIPETNSQLFYNDDPITSSQEDTLERKTKASQIFRLLKNDKSKSSIAIGIVGNWGDGKSSFMNLIEEKFEGDKAFIIVHFNSWLNISVKSIIQDFFNTVEKEIAPYSFDVSKKIKKYGNTVLSVHKNSTTETILNTINLLPDSSLSDDFENLNKLLNRLNKKIIVFFDDLDRLQPNEVFEVLKLIRNTASFDVFNYIVGYDKKYIHEALKNNQIPNPEKYCEKIFLKEFPLAPISAKEINNFLRGKIIQIQPSNEDEISILFEESDVFSDINSGDFFNSIKNMRDAKRYLNELIISIHGIENEVSLRDFVLVKILKFSYYDVYRLLFDKTQFIESRKDNGYSINEKYNTFKLKEKQNERSNIPTLRAFTSNPNFETSLLKEEIEKLGIYNELEIKTIGNICGRIFKDNNQITSTNSLSLAYGRNYYKYFDDEINDSHFSQAEFIQFINSDFTNMKSIVDKAKSDDKLTALLLFIYKIDVLTDLTSKLQYENFVKILYYIANLPSEGVLRYNGIDQNFIYSTTYNGKNRLVSKFNYSNENELKQFLKPIFYENKAYYDFEPTYLKSLHETFSTDESLNVPFSKAEIREYLIFCFSHNINQITSIDSIFWDCYHLCFIKDWVRDESNGIRGQKVAIEQNKEKLLYEVIPKHLDAFLVNITIPQDWYGDDDNSFKVGISKNAPVELFGSIEGFTDYLKSERLQEKLTEYPSEFINEFLNFAEEVIPISSGFIDFNFTYQPINDKLNQLKNRELIT
jgi:hypothetical protein